MLPLAAQTSCDMNGIYIISLFRRKVVAIVFRVKRTWY